MLRIVCKPVGRGNWALITIDLQWRHAAPLVIAVGHEFELGGTRMRVCSVSSV